MKKLSIIIPVFNSGKTIAACLDSIIQQEFDGVEVLIVDGLSNDNSLDIVRAYQDKHDWIRLISEKDDGIYDAMNKGVRNASGAWLYFLGSDDVLHSNNVLKSIFGKSDLSEKYDLIYGNVIFKHSGKRYDGKFDAYRLIEKNICHQAIFYRKELFEKIGLYQTKYIVLADYVFNILCFSDRSVRKHYIDTSIAIYNEKGFSSNCFDKEYRKDYFKLMCGLHPYWVVRTYFNRPRNFMWKLAYKVLLERKIYSLLALFSLSCHLTCEYYRYICTL